MKKLLFLILLIPISAFADFSGVYQGHFERNGYLCKFDADLIHADSRSITLVKWMTTCSTPNTNDYSTNIHGPLTFTILGDKKIEVKNRDGIDIYDTRDSVLTKNHFKLAYSIYTYLDNIELRYDIFIEFKLVEGVLKYNIYYKQNEQLIFSDSGYGAKIL